MVALPPSFFDVTLADILGWVVTLVSVAVAAVLAVMGWERATRTAVETQLRATRERRARVVAQLQLRLDRLVGTLNATAQMIRTRSDVVSTGMGADSLAQQLNAVRDAELALRPHRAELAVLDSPRVQRDVEGAMDRARGMSARLKRESRAYASRVALQHDPAFFNALALGVDYTVRDIGIAMAALSTLESGA
jgi:hypothetical protein